MASTSSAFPPLSALETPPSQIAPLPAPLSDFPPLALLPPAPDPPPPPPPIPPLLVSVAVPSQIHPSPASYPSPSKPTAPPPLPQWSSLFKAKPRNAGIFRASEVSLTFSGNTLIPPVEILKAGDKEWCNYLVGFFLDEPLPYSTVIYLLKRTWRLTGTIKVKTNGFLFFFLLSSEEDRNRILEADPVILRNKLFIIKPWDSAIGNSCCSIKKVPVWIKMFDIPMYAWSLLGISWLASRVGRFLCMDESTEKLDRLEFAKCMVEVSPNQDLPDEFPIQMVDGSVHFVRVSYLWKPLICCRCKAFGHNQSSCLKHNKDKENVAGGDGKITVEKVIVSKKSVDSKAESGNVTMPIKRKQNGVWIKVRKRNMRSNTTKARNQFSTVESQCNNLNGAGKVKLSDEDAALGVNLSEGKKTLARAEKIQRHELNLTSPAIISSELDLDRSTDMEVVQENKEVNECVVVDASELDKSDRETKNENIQSTVSNVIELVALTPERSKPPTVCSETREEGEIDEAILQSTVYGDTQIQVHAHPVHMSAQFLRADPNSSSQLDGPCEISPSFLSSAKNAAPGHSKTKNAAPFVPLKLSHATNNAKSSKTPKKINSNCYDHILPPAAYRAPPPFVESNVSTSPIASPQTTTGPMTRRMKVGFMNTMVLPT